MRKILENGADDPTLPGQREYKRILEETSTVPFSQEEGYGRYLDIHKNHLQFLNIKGIQKGIDYLQYIQVFHKLDEIPSNIKRQAAYSAYLETLTLDLADYLSRVQPLYDQTLESEKLRFEFEEKWDEGKFTGWKRNKAGGALKKDAGALNLDEFSNVVELEALGLERLKSGLMALGLKCGGTLEQRAERLWGVKGKSWDDIPTKLKVGNKEVGYVTFLVIPHFVGVTKIKDAQHLWNQLKAQKTAEMFNPNTEEEFEDQLSNILNKKTFDDLRRQGLC